MARWAADRGTRGSQAKVSEKEEGEENAKIEMRR